MEYSKIRFSQKVTGQERKFIAAVIAESLNETVKYAGAPTFAYEVSGWTVDKNSALHSPELKYDELYSIKPVIEALNIAGLSAKGEVSIKLKTELNEPGMDNLRNLISSKHSLIKKALQTEMDIVVLKEEETVSFSFGKATLNSGEIKAYVTLAGKLVEQAKILKRISLAERSVENKKYAFRCFLLRLGFIGDEYKSERKVLMSRFEGSASFRDGPPAYESEVSA